MEPGGEGGGVGWGEGYLNKDKVPYLNACRVIIINQWCSITTTKPVVMYFSARSTRTSITHLPEIVLLKIQRIKLDKISTS